MVHAAPDPPWSRLLVAKSPGLLPVFNLSHPRTYVNTWPGHFRSIKPRRRGQPAKPARYVCTPPPRTDCRPPDRIPAPSADRRPAIATLIERVTADINAVSHTVLLIERPKACVAQGVARASGKGPTPTLAQGHSARKQPPGRITTQLARGGRAPRASPRSRSPEYGLRPTW